jgi:hypothetical protein
MMKCKQTLQKDNTLKVLSHNEINDILRESKVLPEKQATSILDEFESDHPEIYQAIFGDLSDGVAEINQDMANLFLDLCFDIIFIYRKVFGKLPRISNEEQCMVNSMSLLDAELKAISEDIPMEKSLRNRLQKRFINRSVESGIQMDLLNHLNTEVTKYASFNKKRQPAIYVTNNLLFVIVRLMDALYENQGIGPTTA